MFNALFARFRSERFLCLDGPVRHLRCLAIPFFGLLLTACTQVPTRSALDVPSPNFDARRANLIVLHHTGSDSVSRALRALTSPERKVSSHYLIDREGTLIRLVDESARAWHAGKSWWGGITDVNSVSIGIELDNDGSEPFPEVQIDALLKLLTEIRMRYPIPSANVVAHADVAPSRKDDPSTFFPWSRLAAQGFGLWCDPPFPPAPEGFDLDLALAAIGYDPATPEASRRAFRLHFLAGESDPPQGMERDLAYCLVRQKRTPETDLSD